MAERSTDSEREAMDKTACVNARVGWMLVVAAEVPWLETMA